MRTLALAAVLLLAVTVLAGCADDPLRYPSPASSSSTSSSRSSTSVSETSTASSSSSSTTSSPAPGNQAPTLRITVAGNSSGAAPFNTTFLLNGTDADGDAISWILSFGDNSTNATGTALPAEVAHTYQAAGNYTATFRAADGQEETTAEYEVRVSASGAGAYTGPPAIVFSGESANYGPLGCGGMIPGTATYHDFDGGLARTWLFKASPDTMITEWWTADASSENLGAAGTVPAGRDNVAVCPDASALPVAFPAEAYTLTLYHPDDVPPA